MRHTNVANPETSSVAPEMILNFQNVSQESTFAPEPSLIEAWAAAALEDEEDGKISLSVRIVDENEISDLNQKYRAKPGSTNVLSFRFEDPPGVDSDELGDVIICAPVVAREAKENGKSELAHWAHMVVHGVLHLRGFDHELEDEARIMENKEVIILSNLGFPHPYQ